MKWTKGGDAMKWTKGMPVMTMHMGGMPVAARVIDPEGGKDDVVWIDICVMGSHLPQMYRPHELEELTTEKCEANGLCVTCMGYGSTADNLPMAANSTEVSACFVCGGTGRQSIKATITRHQNGVDVQLDFQPHTYLEGPLFCLACGNQADHPSHT